MNPPIFELAAASSAVTALLGIDPVRFYSFGEAPPKPTAPYGVWQTAYGSPQNTLAGVPKEDSWGVQIDAYAAAMTQARLVGQALRDALEASAYVVSWNGESRDPETGLYRYSFTVEFMTAR